MNSYLFYYTYQCMYALGVYWKSPKGEFYSNVNEEQFHTTGVGQYLLNAEMAVNAFL